MKLYFYPHPTLDRRLLPLAPYATIADQPRVDAGLLHSAIAKDALMRITDDMLAVMQGCKGIGLAANQVGGNFRIFVMMCPDDSVKMFLNPRIVETHGEKVKMREACLSFPGLVEEEERFEDVVVEAITCADDYETDTYSRVQLEGIEAQCAQHEIDHLNGVHMATGAGPVKRDQIKRKVLKASRALAR